MRGKKLILLGAFLAILTGFSAGFVLYTKTAEKPVTATPTQATEQVKPQPPTVQELFDLTNTERAKAGVPLLVLDPRLNQSAQAKCDDMVARKYWSHNSPDGQEPWVFLDQINYRFYKAGENLGKNYDSASEYVVNWMVSPEHKKNLIDPLFENVGFGVCQPNAYLYSFIVVQHLAQPR